MKEKISQLTVCAVLLSSLCLEIKPVGAQLVLPRISPSPTVKKPPTTAPSPEGEKPSPESKAFDLAIKDAEKSEGLFILYRNKKTGKIYAEIKPEQLNKNFLIIATLESGIGESGLYRGMPLQNFVFYFQKVDNNLQFVVRNLKFRVNPGDPQERSLNNSFSDSVLYSLKIIGTHSTRKTILIDLDSLLLNDLAQLQLAVRRSLDAAYQIEDSKTYFGKAETFPLNVEIESIYGFSSGGSSSASTLPDDRALTLKVHYSLSQLPENNGYIPRLADDRIGYFITTYQNFSNINRKEPFIRYINRWNLEKAEPTNPLSPPKKPIVFWIENTVPLEYRDAIREGVLMWNPAFEKAGFKNAIEVRQMPDNAQWSPADARYNTIRWFNSVDGFFAMGPSRVNPLTGEILDADIIIDANMLIASKREYRLLVEPNKTEDKKTCDRQKEDDDLCFGLEFSRQSAIGEIALSLLHPDELDSTQRKEFIRQYLRFLVAHEVGHTLGLRHNFHGSTLLKPEELNNPEITRTKGLVSSVMDYVPMNLAPPGVKQGDYYSAVVGPYDLWAIEYGYKPHPGKVGVPESELRFLEEIAERSPNPELAYATDEDTLDINPNVNRWDLSSDMLVYGQWQMENARLMFARLEKSSRTTSDTYTETRLQFNAILYHYFGNVGFLTDYIGGIDFNRDRPSSPGSRLPFAPVKVEQQRQALAALNKYLFADDSFHFSPELLNQLAPSRWRDWSNPAIATRLDYPIHERILAVQGGVLRSLLADTRLERLRDLELKAPPGQALTLPELFDTLTASIWTEVMPGAAKNNPVQISSLRRALQREYLSILLGITLRNAEAPEDARTLSWYQLRQLRQFLKTTLQSQSNLDTYTKAHLEETSDRITKALDAQLQSK